MRRSTFITERQNKTTTDLTNSRRQNQIKEVKEVKDNDTFNLRKFNNLNIDINKILRTINILFDFKNFQKYKLQPLEKVSFISYYI
jgi:hypothetical protein